MPKPLAKKHIDALRRHGQMWEVQPAERGGRLERNDFFVETSIALRELAPKFEIRLGHRAPPSKILGVGRGTRSVPRHPPGVR